MHLRKSDGECLERVHNITPRSHSRIFPAMPRCKRASIGDIGSISKYYLTLVPSIDLGHTIPTFGVILSAGLLRARPAHCRLVVTDPADQAGRDLLIPLTILKPGSEASE